MMNKTLTKKMQTFSDNVVKDLARDFAINSDKLEFPIVKVFKGKRLKDEDRDCVGVYDPETVEIHLVVPEGKTYKEYKKLKGSPVIGNYKSSKSRDALNVLFYHELAHWMVDYVLKDYSHKHGRAFRVCYAYLRRKYGAVKD